jgi:hypothetical protein
MSTTENISNESNLDKFVFMDKTLSILDAGLKTEKNVMLYGPGGHGKSEIVEEFLYEKGIVPYVLTMGSGMSAERLFGGINIPVLNNTGKLEYLVENSFMNHEYVIFEELLDAADFILEQLKDVLSSGYFRNGTQVFEIKTRYVIACTNRTRAEFSKSTSLKALMERFPLELNVIWDNYNETTYTKLFQTRWSNVEIDPIIPFLLSEYVKAGVIISPRIALDAYEVYQECGPDALMFIAEFAQKSNLIGESIKKYKETLEFKKLSASIEETIENITNNNASLETDQLRFVKDYSDLTNAQIKLKAMTVTEDFAAMHASVLVLVKEKHENYAERHKVCLRTIANRETKAKAREAEGKLKESRQLLEEATIVTESEIVKKPRAKRVKKSV